MSRTAMCQECATDFACSDFGPIPKICPDCKAGEKKSTVAAPVVKVRKVKTSRGNGKTSPAAHSNGHEPPDALGVIDAFDLDFNSGNAVRYMLEQHDGDRLQNLRTAQTYIERAIARLEVA